MPVFEKVILAARLRYVFPNRYLFPEKVYCTETRPYNQGARLTAYELVHDKIPGTLICDDMVAAALKAKQITAVVVGADRIAANGDTANKIGTYQVIKYDILIYDYYIQNNKLQ